MTKSPEWCVADIEADVSAGDWIRDAIPRFGHLVGSLVPPIFDAYCRVLHPPQDAHHNWTRWSTVADHTRATIHPTVEWDSMIECGTLSGRGSGAPAVWDEAPNRGELVNWQRRILAQVLAAHTQSPDDCRFGIWEGQSFQGVDLDGPRLKLPSRNHHLFHGRVIDAVNHFQGHGPSIWWPADRSWLVATDVDLVSTYIGCTAVCSRDVRNTPGLEVVMTSAENQITWDSDTINPLPPNPRG